MDDNDRDRQLPQPLYTDHRHGMKIKLKIDKPNLGDRELKIEEKVKEQENYRNGEEIEPIELTRVVAEKQLDLRACDFCGKTFGNGKALGGHRRIHLHGGDGQIQKAAAEKKARIDHHQDSSDRRSSDPNRTCCICGKSFPSEKSLFGHMRFHPERTWRGVKPPAGAPARLSSSSSTISDEEVPDLEETERDHDPREFVDLIGSLTGWAQKNRRGKRSTYVDPSDPSDHESDRTDGNGLGRYGYDDTVPDDVAAHSLLYLAGGTEKGRIGYGRDHGSYGEDEHDQEPRRFRCGTCGRAFATFQALGGHRSSHSKINGGESTSSDHYRQNCDDHSNGVHEHKCKICDRSFPSGQALGGHQRSHWAGPTLGERSETTSSGLGNGNGKRKLEIDLNEPPETEEEEEAGGGAQSGRYETIYEY